MGKNLRKNKITDIKQLVQFISSQSLDLGEQLMFAREEIKNDELIILYWNLLVDYYKNNAREELGDAISSAGIGIMTGAVASQILQPDVIYPVSLLTGFIVLETGRMLDTSWYQETSDSEQQEILDRLKIVEPALYDVELLFNGWNRNDIDTTEFDGKQRFIEAHFEYITENKFTEKEKLYLKSKERRSKIKFDDEDKFEM